jgi:hypothetical protein
MSKRRNYNTTLKIELMKELKILAVGEEKRVNDLMEEAIQDLLEKYKTKEKS